MQESGVDAVILVICTLPTWGWYPVFLCSESPRGALSRMAVGLMATTSLFTEMAGGILCPQTPDCQDPWGSLEAVLFARNLCQVP